VIRHIYGPHADQFIELTSPEGDALAVVVIIHGGFWRAAYDASLGRPLAADLARRGFVACNIEFRRVGNGGGWPATFDDVAGAIDLLADLEVDTSRVITLGHSAGGHLATWAAGRVGLPASAPGGTPRVVVSGAISQAGVLDLRTAALTSVGGRACLDLVGGSPSEMPERYGVADPMARVPLPVPVVCVHSRGDEDVPFAQSETYVAAACAAGADAELLDVPGDHMAHVDTRSTAWGAALAGLARLTRS
jgi:acetyl esterase/lipase